MVSVRHRLGNREVLLEADNHGQREVGAGGHAGNLLTRVRRGWESGRMTEQRVTDIVPGPGGVMTDEVGVVTGDLTLRTEVDDALNVVVRVQYKDAAEWYTVTGARSQLADLKDIDAIHTIAVATLHRPEG
ncbi:hypothetical protein [Luedemannella helvata]